MHNQTSMRSSFKRLLRNPGMHVLTLAMALGTSVSVAQTGYVPTVGHVPTEQNTYPEPITAIPAVLSQCFACHGPNGRSEYRDWPSLAGQKESYLLQQLQSFKAGERTHPMMQPVVAVLDDDDFKVAAKYLSAQPPPQPQHDQGEAQPAKPAKLPICIACHDNAALPDEPYLHAQQQDYLAAQLKAFRSGERHNVIMEPFAKDLTDDDIAELAAYFSAQPHIAAADK